MEKVVNSKVIIPCRAEGMNESLMSQRLQIEKVKGACFRVYGQCLIFCYSFHDATRNKILI